MNKLTFDIETVPDVESARKNFGLEALADAEVAEAMFAKRRTEKGGRDFLPHHLQKIITISLCVSTPETIKVCSLGDTHSSESEILQKFFAGIAHYRPQLISWNGGRFDLPVLHYRALLHGIDAKHYWEKGDEIQGFKWNNYINRYHDRHIDLMDVLASYNASANAPLTEIAIMLGLPGKMGIGHGGNVWDTYLAGDLEAIRNYCEIDVLNTYLIFLRYQLMCGQHSNDTYDNECRRLSKFLQDSADDGSVHFLKFLDNWSR